MPQAISDDDRCLEQPCLPSSLDVDADTTLGIGVPTFAAAREGRYRRIAAVSAHSASQPGRHC